MLPAWSGELEWQWENDFIWEWVNENCYEEHIRRLRNYMKPYMQNDENVNWIKDVDWIFDENEYKGVIEKYRKIKNSELLSPSTERS